jgi:hypothetical protein
MEPAPEITFAALRDLFNRAIQKAAEATGARPQGGADTKNGSAAPASPPEGSTRTPPGDGK